MAATLRDMVWAETARTAITDLTNALNNYAALADENTKSGNLARITDADLTAANWGMTAQQFTDAVTAFTALRTTFDTAPNGARLFRARR